MPELNPRRAGSKKSRFAQVSAAVLAGMAAMFCLQNLIEFRREAARPAPPAAATAPSPPEPSLAAPEGDRRPAAPAASSMMLKSEPGLAAGGSVLGVSGEEAPPRLSAPEAAKPAKPKKAAPHLEERTMTSPFASSAVRNDGRFTAIKRRAPAAAAEAPTPAAPAPKPAAGATTIRILEKTTPEPENLQAALIAQRTEPTPVFWTRERIFSVGAAAALAILGVLYVFYSAGVFSSRTEEPL